jgi:hypothetical protein
MNRGRILLRVQLTIFKIAICPVQGLSMGRTLSNRFAVCVGPIKPKNTIWFYDFTSPALVMIVINDAKHFLSPRD